jgi:hypothetical protein
VLISFFSVWLSICIHPTATAQDNPEVARIYIIAATQQNYNNLVKRSFRRRDKGDTATLYGDRGWGSIRTCNILVDGVLVCNLNQLRYFIQVVSPGTHRISMQQPNINSKEDNSKIILLVEGGKTYYLLLCFDWQSKLKEQYFMQLSGERANMVLPSIRQDRSCKL